MPNNRPFCCPSQPPFLAVISITVAMDVIATHFKRHSAKEVGMQAPNIESMSALDDALVFELLPGISKRS